MEVGLIGSCTNSSYQDLSRAASLARQVKEKNLKVASPLIVNPGSEQIRATAERDGMIAAFEDIGATIMANAADLVLASGSAILMTLPNLFQSRPSAASSACCGMVSNPA